MRAKEEGDMPCRFLVEGDRGRRGWRRLPRLPHSIHRAEDETACRLFWSRCWICTLPRNAWGCPTRASKKPFTIVERSDVLWALTGPGKGGDATAELKFCRLLYAPFDQGYFCCHQRPKHVGYKKLRYGRLAKNTSQFFSLFALVNRVTAKRRLFELDAQGVPCGGNGLQIHLIPAGKRMCLASC